MLDVLIIGCGIVGTAVAYELSRYKLNVTAVDRLNDIAGETTRANSGLIHAGFHPRPGTLMARLNVRGSILAKELCEKLDVPYKQNGALVLGFNETDRETIETLYNRGIANGVKGLEIITGEQARALEPQLSTEVICALNAPTAAVISPWEFAAKLAETAALNGVGFSLNTEVSGLAKTENGYIVHTSKGEFKTKAIVNAAGLYADKIHGWLQQPDFIIKPNRGQYYLLDKSSAISRTIFQCPDKKGKGILVTPTVHGNVLVGPSSEDVAYPNNTATETKTLEHVWDTATKSVPGLNRREIIRTFAGVRANTSSGDFIIREVQSGFYDLAGIKSPGLSSAPAIAEELVKLMGGNFKLKENFIDTRRKVHKSIEENPAYGRIVCRCESITEGEIIDALHSPIPPTTLDGIKRRVHAGMGRCQGGFCSPRIIEIIAKHLNIPPQEVLKDRMGSYIITGVKGEQECTM